MFSTFSIIDKLKQEESLEYKKLCRLLKLTKKSEKDKLLIALGALEKLEIINKNSNNEYSNVKDKKHIVAKIRCSSKGYCFAVRDNNTEDIYIKENLLNHAWNGDKVLVRILKEGVRRRSPEGIIDCILERTNQILLAKVDILNGEVYGIPIDDRILAKIKLPKEDEKYKFIADNKNIVKVKIDRFPIGQNEGVGHVIKELKLNNNENFDTEFVLSKTNLNISNKNEEIKLENINQDQRIDLTGSNSYMLKSWNSQNAPLLPIFQIEKSRNKGFKLWIHTNSIAERLDIGSKKNIDIFIDRFESFPLLNGWQNYLSENIVNTSEFKLNEVNEALSLCIEINSNFKIVNWSFHLTKVKCVLIVGNKQLEALFSKKSNARITSRILKPIKEHIEDLETILEISKEFRKNQTSNGRIEIKTPNNNIDSLNELFIHNPVDFSNEYFEPLNPYDIQTFISPLLYEANILWFKHSREYGLNNASFISQDLDYINTSDLIKHSELIDSNIQLNESGSLTFKELIESCNDQDKKRILNKLLINLLRHNQAKLITKESQITKSEKIYISPWTLPSFDFINLMNQYNIYNMIINGKRNNKSNSEVINIMEKDSWEKVKWNIYNSSITKNMALLFNELLISKINDYKNKVRQYKSNIINIKQVRQAEKLINNSYSGLITTVQSYGFFVEITELQVEGLVHVSTLNNDWYEYRSRQNLLIGRKSKKSYKIGDVIEIKIMKVDILKYQIDLELVNK